MTETDRLTTTVRTGMRITYTYRLVEGGKLHSVRRPAEGFTDHEWITQISSIRAKLYRMMTGGPFYENLTTGGYSIRCPGKFTGRHSEIATAIERLKYGCKPADSPYING